MAKIRRLPSLAIISGFKGTIDFYEHDGQACVRAWPKSPGKSRSQAVMAQWPAFTYAAQAWATLDPRLRTLYDRMAKGTTFTGRDMFTRSYLGKIYPHE